MNRKAYASIFALMFLAISFLTGCSSGSSTNHTTPPPTIAITATSGGGQSATVDTAFTSPLVATVTSNGSPASGVTVTFTAPAQTGASGTFAGGTNTATTNASGVATSPAFTANGIAGTYAVTATTSGATTPASFSLTNTAGVPPTIAITATSGGGQSATVGTAFTSPLVATVTSNGSPASGVTVTFTAPAQTGASGTFAGGTNTATTNASGVATSPAFTANGIAGTYAVTATTSGATTPASFSLTNTAGAAATVTATSGSGQSALVSTQFTNPLVATVTDSNSNPVSGASVTFAAPTSGQSGTFATTPPAATDTETTNVSGVATSQLFTANATPGAYAVTATVGTLTPASFTLTNAVNTYAFYLSGLEAINGGDNFYAVAGSVAIAGGAVLGGELDYNDAFGNTSPNEPTPDSITGGTLTTDGVTGQYTLTLNTSNTNLGVGGVITLGVQFVNNNHALITQFDGSATSSGSLDLQNLTTPPSGNFSFTLSGVDNTVANGSTYLSVVVGGVFSIVDGGVTGIFDIDDFAAPAAPVLGTTFTGSVSGSPDQYGRGYVTGTPFAAALAYYGVGPEAIRLIDVDPTESTVGSAFGQGTGNTFTNASLGSSVFGIESNSYGFLYVAAGSFTIPTAGTFTGIGDDDEEGFVFSAATIEGTYSVSNAVGGTTYNGYSSLTFTTPLQDVTNLGIYLTDPQLNLNDPNNTSSGLGGALVADLDVYPINGTGVLIPQTDTTPADFTGSTATYAFGVQDYNAIAATGWEFDSVGQGSFTGGAFAGTGLLNDVFDTFGTSTPDTGVTFTGAPLADSDENTTGRYTLLDPNFLVVTVPTNPATVGDFNAVIYQASGTQAFWLNEDDFSLWLGLIEQQGSLTGVPAVKKGSGKSAKPKQK